MPSLRHIRFSPITLLALGSVCALLGVIAYQIFVPHVSRPYVPNARTQNETAAAYDATWQQEMMLLGIATSSDPGVIGDSDPIALISPQVLAQLIGEYNGLQASGSYSAKSGQDAATQIAPNVYANVVYQQYKAGDIKSVDDTSYARMLTYRADLQNALQPLLENKTAEYALYGAYVETGNESNLNALQASADNYSAAAKAAAKIIVPKDALAMHVALLNALSQFSATLDNLVTHAADPIASMALLRTYNDSETAVVSSFDTIAQYARSKMP